MDQENNQISDLNEVALDNWKHDALERRSTRKLKGSRGALATFQQWPLWQRLLVIVPSSLFAVVLVVGLVDTVAAAGRIHPGVEASGIPVGGLRVREAEAKIAGVIEREFGKPVTVSYKETPTWQVTAVQLGAEADSRRAAEAAFAVGRSGGFLSSVVDRLTAWFTPAEVQVPISSDESMTAGVLEVIALAVDRAPEDATVAIDNLEPSVVPAKPGIAVSRERLKGDIVEALLSNDRAVNVTVETVPVKITDEAAAPALDEVRRMLAGPVQVTHEAEKWQFTAQEIAGWIMFRPAAATESTGSAESSTPVGQGTPSVSQEPVLEAYIDGTKATKIVGSRVGGAGHAAVDATFKVSSGSVTIVPSQDGVGPDIEALAAEMTVVLKSTAARNIELRTRRVEPEITTEKARGMGIKERISTYTTTFSAGNKPRVNNIHTLADAIDGTLIAPGETFSFNGTVGERTASKGYQEAPAIVQGKLVPQLGGGICQVGTTLFNTVFESGLPVVERHNHSLYISHYPKGRDATVSWGGPDFKFKNDTATWVLLAAGYSNSSLTLSLYGTDPGYDVTAAVGSWTNIRAHAVKEIPDPTLAVGKRVIEQQGADGRTIVVTRTVRKNGAVVRENTFKSTYRSEEEVVRIGTKSVSTTPSATPSP
ncbi:MAG: VanW family protein [Coriobacteriia bacterium]